MQGRQTQDRAIAGRPVRGRRRVGKTDRLRYDQRRCDLCPSRSSHVIPLGNLNPYPYHRRSHLHSYRYADRCAQSSKTQPDTTNSPGPVVPAVRSEVHDQSAFDAVAISARSTDTSVTDPRRETGPDRGLRTIGPFVPVEKSPISSGAKLDAIHIVSRETDGAVKLGNTWLTADNVDAYAGQFTNWGSSLTSDADLMFYGCDLAGSEGGQTLVQSLRAHCDCDVAASMDDTDHLFFGGDWDPKNSTMTHHSLIMTPSSPTSANTASVNRGRFGSLVV